ncbi:hypothetical protein FGIG_10176 [Fasciola gigantica]|uniref:Uncharacterized protein n=1 Tax=Fasciola gigantica TaxID=46835 RepID=A0A504YZL3_FASGI|nr:hypothetical protein FGIG_10176 [Fasciola gigantica]
MMQDQSMKICDDKIVEIKEIEKNIETESGNKEQRVDLFAFSFILLITGIGMSALSVYLIDFLKKYTENAFPELPTFSLVYCVLVVTFTVLIVFGMMSICSTHAVLLLMVCLRHVLLSWMTLI